MAENITYRNKSFPDHNLMKIRFFFQVIFLLLFASKAYATSSMYCDCSKDGYVIEIHVNTDNELVDVNIYNESNKIIALNSNQLNHFELIWKKTEAPFTGNKLVINHNKKSDDINFHIEVNGPQGYLYLNNKRFKIICDWLR